jgi:predicted porin
MTNMVLLACLAAAGFVSTPALADAASDLRAEVAAQRARLDALEKKLDMATMETAIAKEAAKEATKAAAASAASAAGASGGNALSMPKGLTIYGIADAGLEFGDYGQGSKARIQSGLGSASRLGFKGLREFGDDMAAYFQLEAGVSFDNGQNTGHSSNISNPGQGSTSSSAPNTTGVAVFSRNTFVGLRSKVGDIRFGRDYAPIYSITSASDPFTIGGATAFRLWSSAAASRFDNAVFYASPKFAGFGLNLAYSAGMENNSNANVGLASGATNSIGPKDEGKGTSGSVTYNKGPLFAAAGYLNYLKTGAVTAPATENFRRTSWNLAATYDLKAVKFYAQYLQGKDDQAGGSVALDRTIWWLGLSAPFRDVHTLRAVYGHLNDKMSTDRDSDHLGLGYEYALDKETDLYVYYAQVTNKNGGQNSLCAGGTCQGYDKDTNLPVNFTPKSLMLGGRYRF